MAHQVSPDCLHCAVGPLFLWINWAGIPKTILACNHANRKVERIKEPVFFKWKALPAILYLILIFTSHYYAVLTVIEDIRNNVKLYDHLFKAVDFLLYEMVIVGIIEFLFMKSTLESTLLYMDSVLKHFATYTSHHILSIDVAIQIRKIAFLCQVFRGITSCVTTTMIFVYEIEPRWSIIEKFCIMICIDSGFMVFILFISFIKLYAQWHKKYNHFLKLDLDNFIYDKTILNLTNEDNCIVSFPQENSIGFLRIYAETYIALVKFSQKIMEVFSAVVLIVILLGEIIFIIILFVIVLFVVYQIPVTPRICSILIVMLIAILLIGYIMSEVTKCNFHHIENRSYLEKFQLSALNPTEKLQFECLLYVIQKYPTDLKASGILPLDISQFADILAVILTYVIVAVQFQFVAPTVFFFKH